MGQGSSTGRDRETATFRAYLAAGRGIGINILIPSCRFRKSEVHVFRCECSSQLCTTCCFLVCYFSKQSLIHITGRDRGTPPPPKDEGERGKAAPKETKERGHPRWRGQAAPEGEGEKERVVLHLLSSFELVISIVYLW